MLVLSHQTLISNSNRVTGSRLVSYGNCPTRRLRKRYMQTFPELSGKINTAFVSTNADSLPKPTEKRVCNRNFLFSNVQKLVSGACIENTKRG